MFRAITGIEVILPRSLVANPVLMMPWNTKCLVQLTSI